MSLPLDYTPAPGTIPLFDFQSNGVTEMLEKGGLSDNLLLIGPAGSGKTYVLGRYLQEYFQYNKTKIDSHSFFPVIYLTEASEALIQQTREALYKEFKLPPTKLFVSSYSTLRATLGKVFLKFQTIVDVYGGEREVCIWNQGTLPLLIICDECQKLRNPGTLQTAVIDSYISQGGKVILASATPFTKVGEAKVTIKALQPRMTGLGTINDNNWRTYAQLVSGIKSPDEHNYEAIKRLKRDLEHKIVTLKGIKYKKRTISKCRLIPFESREDERFYNEAYNDYLKDLAKIDKDGPGGMMMIIVAQNKFRERADYIKAFYLARIAVSQQRKGHQIIIGSNFRKALERVKQGLIENHSVDESKISMIVGGQSKTERVQNLKRFQSGETDYLLIMSKAGGVGLSAHHHAKNATICKPRYCLLPLPWSAIEIVQLLGRGHRINSISTTHQDIVGFMNTIEEKVISRLSTKLHCLSELVGKNETWTDTFSQRDVLESYKDLAEAQIREVLATDDDGNEETFAVEAYDNEWKPSMTDIIVEELPLEPAIQQFNPNDITLEEIK